MNRGIQVKGSNKRFICWLGDNSTIEDYLNLFDEPAYCTDILYTPEDLEKVIGNVNKEINNALMTEMGNKTPNFVDVARNYKYLGQIEMMSEMAKEETREGNEGIYLYFYC
jgi:hypothetical protein